MKVARLAALTGLLAVGASAVAAVTTVTSASAAVPPYGPKTVVMTTCSLPANTSNTAIPPVITASGDSGGAIYGFASCRTYIPGAIYFFLTQNGHSIHQATPYRGSLEVAATDGTGAVYLVYSVRTSTSTSVYIARRSAQGQYSPSALLTHTSGTYRPAVALTAQTGKWWAVWSQQLGAQRVLFEQRTLSGAVGRHQLTYPGVNSDWKPALSYAGSAKLIWLRGSPTNTRVLISTNSSGRWSLPVALTAAGLPARFTPRTVSQLDPTNVARNYLVWFAGVPIYRDDFAPPRTLTGAPPFQPYLAVSQGVSTIAEHATGDVVAGPYIHIDEKRSGVWSSANWPTVDSMDTVISNGGRATFVMHKSTTPVVYLLTETS